MHAAFSPPFASLVSLQGSDARDFLGRLSTADLRSVSPGMAVPAFLLNPQGRIQAAFTLACTAEDHFHLEIEDGPEGRWKAALLQLIDQFTFAERFELKSESDRECLWVIGERPNPPDGIVINHGSARFGEAWFSVWANPEPIAALEKTLATATEAELETLRIARLQPRIDHEITPDYNPLEIGLRHAIPDNKGCYPGQEVIEKIVALGSPAKRLVRLRGTGEIPSRGPLLDSAGAEIGTVTSVAGTSASDFTLLAIVRKNFAQIGKKFGNLEIDAIAPYEK